MKNYIALALWLAAGGYAWADGADSPQVAPTGWSKGESFGQAVVPIASAPSQSGQAPAPVSSGYDPLPPPSPLFQEAQEAISPLAPKEVRQLRKESEAIDKAIAAPVVTIVPRISSQTVNLSAGASLPLVRTAVNHPSSLTFMDSTGAPWKLGAAPISGNPNFIVYYVPDSPVMVVYANKPFSSGNITVYLAGLPVPIVLNVTSGETDTQAETWTVDSRLDLRVPGRGPAAHPGAAPEISIGLHDSTLQAFLDGIPPKEAHRLKTTGLVPDTIVWQLGDDLYIRSRSDIRDEFEATLSSADGTHLWKLPVTPYVSFSVMGRTAALNVALE